MDPQQKRRLELEEFRKKKIDIRKRVLAERNEQILPSKAKQTDLLALAKNDHLPTVVDGQPSKLAKSIPKKSILDTSQKPHLPRTIAKPSLGRQKPVSQLEPSKPLKASAIAVQKPVPDIKTLNFIRPKQNDPRSIAAPKKSSMQQLGFSKELNTLHKPESQKDVGTRAISVPQGPFPQKLNYTQPKQVLANDENVSNRSSEIQASDISNNGLGSPVARNSPKNVSRTPRRDVKLFDRLLNLQQKSNAKPRIEAKSTSEIERGLNLLANRLEILKTPLKPVSMVNYEPYIPIFDEYSRPEDTPSSDKLFQTANVSTDNDVLAVDIASNLPEESEYSSQSPIQGKAFSKLTQAEPEALEPSPNAFRFDNFYTGKFAVVQTLRGNLITSHKNIALPVVALFKMQDVIDAVEDGKEDLAKAILQIISIASSQDHPTMIMSKNRWVHIKTPLHKRLPFWLLWSSFEEKWGNVEAAAHIFLKAIDNIEDLQQKQYLVEQYRRLESRHAPVKTKLVMSDNNSLSKLEQETPAEHKIMGRKPADFVELIHDLKRLSVKENNHSKTKQEPNPLLFSPVIKSVNSKKMIGVPIFDESNPARVTVLTPMKASRKHQVALGVENVITPVRRSMRLFSSNELDSMNTTERVEALLMQYGYAFIPNEVILSNCRTLSLALI
jgi:hypothetical protein